MQMKTLKLEADREILADIGSCHFQWQKIDSETQKVMTLDVKALVWSAGAWENKKLKIIVREDLTLWKKWYQLHGKSVGEDCMGLGFFISFKSHSVGKPRWILQICFSGPPLCLNIDAMEGDRQLRALWHSIFKVTDVKTKTCRIHYFKWFST